MTGLVELVAMSRLGDVYVIRDVNDRWLLMSPLSGAAQRELKTQAEVDRAISYGDLREVNLSFDAYSDLGNYLSEQASLVSIAGIARDQVHSAQQVELLLAGALDWASDGTAEGLDIAAATIDRLLDSEVVRENTHLRSWIEEKQLSVKQVAEIQLRGEAARRKELQQTIENQQRELDRVNKLVEPLRGEVEASTKQHEGNLLDVKEREISALLDEIEALRSRLERATDSVPGSEAEPNRDEPPSDGDVAAAS